MKAGAMPKDLNTKPESWPVLGNPQEIAFAMGGKWTSEPQVPISAIRHRLDLIENDLKGFLFAPEIFARVGGTAARSALLAGVEAVDLGAAGLVVTARPRNLEAGFPCLIVNDPPNAIQKLAVWRRANSSAKFIAVTGSVGKTTTKNMVHCLA